MHRAAPCPLCGSPECTLHHQGAERAFWHCEQCDLVYVKAGERLGYEAEVARYRLHENDAGDAGYVAFLSRLADPVIARTPAGARGLDYGSGATDALGQIFTRSGRPTVSYDPALRADDSLLAHRYTFVTCSEVIEHVHDPRALLERFERLVVPGGLIAIMTTFRDPSRPFGDWWYQRDPTHVCFYSTATMQWIASRYDWSVEIPRANVSLFKSRD